MESGTGNRDTGARVLIVDDEASIVSVFERLLRSEGYECDAASTAEEGLEIARRRPPDAVILDIKLPGMDGLSALSRFREAVARAPVLLITAHGTLETAVRATRSGAFGYLLKPVRAEQLLAALAAALGEERRSEEIERLRKQPPPESGFVGISRASQELFARIAAAAPTDSTVLIVGESGTGKELVARALHRNSARSAGPFEALNCAAIPENLVESELFGHEAGAFTGATVAKRGKFEIADGGTLFLDEVSELSAAAQAKMLRVLEEREIVRVGGTQKFRINVRILAATNRRLEEQIEAGRFREDLFYRLQAVRLEVPPLRDRIEDVPYLTAFFLNRLGAAGITDRALRVLKEHPWPGNVRELRHALEQARVSAGGARPIDVDDLPESIRVPRRFRGGAGARIEEAVDAFLAEDVQEPGAYARMLAAWERPFLERVLRRCGGSQIKAAERLGINRATLRKKLREQGLASGPKEDDSED